MLVTEMPPVTLLLVFIKFYTRQKTHAAPRVDITDVHASITRFLKRVNEEQISAMDDVAWCVWNNRVEFLAHFVRNRNNTVFVRILQTKKRFAAVVGLTSKEFSDGAWSRTCNNYLPPPPTYFVRLTATNFTFESCSRWWYTWENDFYGNIAVPWLCRNYVKIIRYFVKTN